MSAGAAPAPSGRKVDSCQLQGAAWRKLCHHIDGIAIATLIEALHARGAFAAMRHGPARAADLAAAGLTPGDSALTLKLLTGQGILAPAPDGPRLTPFGAALAAQPQWYRGARAAAARARARLAGDDPAPAPPPASAPERVRLQRQGAEVAAAWFHLAGNGWDGAPPHATALLAATGWLTGGPRPRLTEEGRHAAAMARQYAYPLSYLPTFQRAGDIVAGAPHSDPAESHLDRGLDIAFSGDVFNATCREAALAAVLPLFDRPLAGQPAALVDTGSGDGTVLAVLFEAIRTRTLRGRHLARHPLTLVGVEMSPLAERTTRARLAPLATPSLAIPGDIGAPDAIAAALAAHGIEADDALHLNKSVLHDRAHRPPRNTHAAPPTDAVFVGPDGALIPPGDAFGCLVELLAAWRPLIARHGMLAIEAHTVDPVAAAASIGRSLVTSLDAAHGLSRQYLVEIAVHRAAAAAAGLVARTRHDLGAGMMGAPILSVDHLMPASR